MSARRRPSNSIASALSLAELGDTRAPPLQASYSARFPLSSSSGPRPPYASVDSGARSVGAACDELSMAVAVLRHIADAEAGTDASASGPLSHRLVPLPQRLRDLADRLDSVRSSLDDASDRRRSGLVSPLLQPVPPGHVAAPVRPEVTSTIPPALQLQRLKEVHPSQPQGFASAHGHSARSPRLELSKASSVRVAAVPRRVPPGDLVADVEERRAAERTRATSPKAPPPATYRELQRVMCASVYNVLESVVRQCHADSGSIFTKQIPTASRGVAPLSTAPEMVAVANVGPRLRFPPSLVRHQCEGSLAAGVLATGIPVHRRTHASAARPTDGGTLAFPIRQPSGDSLVAHPELLGAPMPSDDGRPLEQPTGPVIAVLVVEDKFGGRAPFSRVDEHLCNMAARILGELMTRLPDFAVDFRHHFYDPIPQHVVVPFVPASAQAGGRDRNDPAFFVTALDLPEGEQAAALKALTGVSDRMAAHVPEQMIRREVIRPSQPGAAVVPDATNTAVSVAGLGPAPALREVEAFLSNLNDCWQQSVRVNVEQQTSERQRLTEMKALREDLLGAKRRVAVLEEELRLRRVDAKDYRNEYSNLHSELESFLRTRTQRQE